MKVVFNDSLEGNATFDNISEKENNNSSLPNPLQKKTVQSSSIDNHCSKILNADDRETLYNDLKTNCIYQKGNNNNITSLIYQRNSIVSQKTTKAFSLADNDTINSVFLHEVDRTDDHFATQKPKEKPCLVELVPDVSPQTKTSHESWHVVRNKQDEVLENKQRCLSQESTREHNKETKCSTLRTCLDANNSQTHQHELETSSYALPAEVCPDLQIKKGTILFGNDDSIGEKESQESRYAETIKDRGKRNEKTIPDFIQTLIDGTRVCGDSYVEFSKPNWFDEEKYKRGQRFARDHYFSIVFADLISLLILFATQSGLKTLIFTRQSDTPYKAFRRYLSTNVRVSSWYDGDIWDVNSEAHKNLKTVRAMHEATRKKMESSSKEELAKKVTLEDDRSTQPMWTDLHEEIHDDFQNSCPFRSPMPPDPNEVCISQGGMAGTQFGFFGLILVYPKMFGIHNASNTDLEGFIHFWRTIAYLLGTEDRFNLCNGDLTTVRHRCVDLIEFWAKPQFLNVSREWIHMSRVMIQGVSFYIFGISFEVALLYLCKILNIKAVKLATSLTFFQWLIYLSIHVVFGFLLRFANMQARFNRMVVISLRKALNFSPEHLQNLKERVYPYEISSGAVTAR